MSTSEFALSGSGVYSIQDFVALDEGQLILNRTLDHRILLSAQRVQANVVASPQYIPWLLHKAMQSYSITTPRTTRDVVCLGNCLEDACLRTWSCAQILFLCTFLDLIGV